MSTTTNRSMDRGGNPWAGAFATAAGVMMLVLGSFQGLQGFAAILTGDVFVDVGDYAYSVDLSTWGWVHLVLGVAIAVTGAFLLMDAVWARMVGISLAVISAIANFMFIPYYPFWAILIIGFDVAVIWALAAYEPERSTA